MQSESERVTVRLPADRLDALQALVDRGKYPTISDAIRAAIDSFVESQFAPDYIKKITIELPKGNMIDLETIVKSGDSVDVKDAIRNAVREYIRKRMERMLAEYEEEEKQKGKA